MAIVAMAVESRICTWCKQVKSFSEFRKDPNTADGYRHECKTCKSTYDRQRHANLSPSIRAQRKKQLTIAHLIRKYQLDEVGYQTLLTIQGDRCAICGKTSSEEGRRLAVDHDHQTGRIRGLLCYNCNRALGHFQENSMLLRCAAIYLEESNGIT